MERDRAEEAVLKHQCEIYVRSLSSHAKNQIPPELSCAVFVYTDGIHALTNINANRQDLIEMLCEVISAPENMAVVVDAGAQADLAGARDAGQSVSVSRTRLRRIAADILYLEGVSSSIMAGTSFGTLPEDLRQVMEAARQRCFQRGLRLRQNLQALGLEADLDFENEDLDD